MIMTMTIVFDRQYGEAYLSANAIAKIWVVRPFVRPTVTRRIPGQTRLPIE